MSEKLIGDWLFSSGQCLIRHFRTGMPICGVGLLIVPLLQSSILTQPSLSLSLQLFSSNPFDSGHYATGYAVKKIHIKFRLRNCWKQTWSNKNINIAKKRFSHLFYMNFQFSVWIFSYGFAGMVNTAKKAILCITRRGTCWKLTSPIHMRLSFSP